MWRDVPAVHGLPKTLYNRFIRWSRIGVFDRIFATLAGESAATDTVMIDATHLKAHRTAASLLKKGRSPPHRSTKGGLNSKLHAVCDREGKPLILLLTEGQVSDYRGAATVLPYLPDADRLIADKGYDSDWFRQALTVLEITPCIPGRGEPKGADPLRRRPLQAAQPHRANVRQAQGLATHRHTIRPLRPHLHERHLHRRNRHLLVMSSEPRAYRGKSGSTVP